jgi:hypothetical protein
MKTSFVSLIALLSLSACARSGFGECGWTNPSDCEDASPEASDDADAQTADASDETSSDDGSNLEAEAAQETSTPDAGEVSDATRDTSGQDKSVCCQGLPGTPPLACNSSTVWFCQTAVGKWEPCSTGLCSAGQQCWYDGTMTDTVVSCQ